MDELTRIFALEIIENYIDPDQCIHWAERLLTGDNDTPSLRILAGLDSKNTDSSEIRKFFFQSLSELGITAPDRNTALTKFSNSILEELLDGQIEHTKALSFLTGCYYSTEDFKFQGWWLLSQVLSEYQADELSKDEINEMINEEARLFKEFQGITIPDRFQEMIFCDRCDYFGLPTEERVHFKWLPKILYRLIFRRWPHRATVCPRCKSYHITYSYEQEGRRRYLNRIKTMANQ